MARRRSLHVRLQVHTPHMLETSISIAYRRARYARVAIVENLKQTGFFVIETSAPTFREIETDRIVGIYEFRDNEEQLLDAINEDLTDAARRLLS